MKFDDNLMMAVSHAIEAGNTPFLVGPPGIGKSSWVEAFAEQRYCTKCFTVACNQLADKADLTGGRLVPMGTSGDYKMVFFPHDSIADAIQYALDNPKEFPILFMDEINRTTADVTSACLSLTTARRIGSKKLPNNLRIIMAGNDKGNVTALDEATISRLMMIPVEPDLDTFIKVQSQPLNQWVLKVLQTHPETLYCKFLRVDDAAGDDDEIDVDSIIDEADAMKQLTTPRTITAVSNWLNKCTTAELMQLAVQTHQVDGQDVTGLQEILVSFTGNTAFTAYLIQEVASGITTSTTNVNNGVNVTKPQCYDNLKRCTDMTSLNQFIAGMSSREKSMCLVYMLYESTDNSAYIRALAPTMDTLHPDESRVLFRMAGYGLINDTNSNALLNTNASITDSLRYILSQ